MVHAGYAALAASIGEHGPRAAHQHIPAACLHIIAQLYPIQYHLPVPLLPLPCLLLLLLLLLLRLLPRLLLPRLLLLLLRLPLWRRSAAAVQRSGAALLFPLRHLDALRN